MNAPVTAELIVAINPENLPIITGMVEQSAKIFGLNQEGAQNLGLASEELFNVLASAAGSDEKIRVMVRNGGYYVETACCFPPHSLPITALNVIGDVDLDSESDIANLGIFLAARVVDRFQLVREREGEMAIRFIMEKEYPDLKLPFGILPPGPYSVHEGGSEDIKQFATRVANTYGSASPVFFRFPGKVVDMVKGKEYGVLLALDGKGNVGGGILWKWNQKMIEVLGPYVFTPQPGLAEEIIQAALEKMSRKGAVCIVNRMPVADVPRSYFEELAGRDVAQQTRTICCQSPLYRQIDEDTGSVAYVHTDLEPFVRECYNRLALPRHITVTTHAGEYLEPHAAFGMQVDRAQHLATLSAIVAGRDAPEVLTHYVSSLEQQEIARFIFELDLGDETTSSLMPALTAAGFVPCYVLPWGGVGDIVIFERQNPRGS